MNSGDSREHTEEPEPNGRLSASRRDEPSTLAVGLDAEAAARALADASMAGAGASRVALARSLQRSAGNAAVGRLIESRAGRPLAPEQRRRFEAAFGNDFGGVRVHESTGPLALEARAVTAGSDIHVTPGAIGPGGAVDPPLLAHELAHVVQQQDAIESAPLTERGSAPEREAESAAGQALRGGPVGSLTPAGVGPARAGPGDTEAVALVDYLLVGASNAEVAEFIDTLNDSRYLRIVRAELKSRLDRTNAAAPDFARLHLLFSLVATRLVVIDATAPFNDHKADFEAIVKRIRERKGTKLKPADEKELKDLLASLSVQQAKELEQEILLWQGYGHTRKMSRIIEIVTAFSRTTATAGEEAARGKFSDVLEVDDDDEEGDDDPFRAGSEIKEELSDAAAQFDGMQCWDFLYGQGLEIIYADKERVAAAKREYLEGAAERKEKTGQGSNTGSRGFTELRLEGLLGPVHLLKWVGTHLTGHHKPSASELVTELSTAGDGWYFFFASVVSFHTLIIAVEVVGSDRRFFVIEAGKKAQRKTRAELDAKFNELDPTRGGERPEHTSEVGSRVWQVYTHAYE